VPNASFRLAERVRSILAIEKIEFRYRAFVRMVGIGSLKAPQKQRNASYAGRVAE